MSLWIGSYMWNLSIRRQIQRMTIALFQSIVQRVSKIYYYLQNIFYSKLSYNHSHPNPKHKLILHNNIRFYVFSLLTFSESIAYGYEISC